MTDLETLAHCFRLPLHGDAVLCGAARIVADGDGTAWVTTSDSSTALAMKASRVRSVIFIRAAEGFLTLSVPVARLAKLIDVIATGVSRS